MGALLRDTTFYDNQVNKKYLQDTRKHLGRPVKIPFELLVASPSAGADTYNLCVLPAQWRVVDALAMTDGLGASAGAGRTFQVGDSGDDDRYIAAFDADVAEAVGRLAFAGLGYTPTADTIVVGKMHATNAAVVGKKVNGWLAAIPFAA